MLMELVILYFKCLCNYIYIYSQWVISPHYVRMLC